MTGRQLPMLDPSGRPTAGSGAPVKAVEADDPLELVAVSVPVDEPTFDEMASSFVEEFVRDGWTDRRLIAYFRAPYYAGLHVIWQRRGERWVRELIAATRVRWRRPDPNEPEVRA